MKYLIAFAACLLVSLMVPTDASAQTLQLGVRHLQGVLDNVYNQMVPLCGKITTLARAIAAFGASFYIGYRVWKHIANAEPIDFFPLFRPFVLTILIGMFPTTMSCINAILNPAVTATAALVDDSDAAVQNLLDQRENAIKNTDEWQTLMGPVGGSDNSGPDKYSQPDDSGGGFWSSLWSGIKFTGSLLFYGVKYFFKYLISILLELIYYAAVLIIDTMRTFKMIVLVILGPFVFALACFDGFEQSLIHWLGRYINVFMWLPICNVYGAILNQIQINMLKIDLGQIQASGTTYFTATDGAYLIYLLIGIVGYFTVPQVANWIIHAHGADAISNKVFIAYKKVSGATIRMASGLAGGGGGGQRGGGGNSNSGSASAGNNDWGRKRIQG